MSRMPPQSHGDRPQLVGVHRLRPPVIGFELHREEDEREEDQVVRHVHQHDEALAGPGIRPEDVGGVALPESPDERPQPQGKEHHSGEPQQLQDPPVHDELSLCSLRRRPDHRGNGAEQTPDH